MALKRSKKFAFPALTVREEYLRHTRGQHARSRSHNCTASAEEKEKKTGAWLYMLSERIAATRLYAHVENCVGFELDDSTLTSVLCRASEVHIILADI